MNTKMNIGMVLDKEFPPDTRVENEASMLINNGHEVKIICYNSKKKLPRKNYHSGIQIKRLSKSMNWIKKGRALIGTIFDYYSNYWAKEITDFISTYKIDVLHVHDLYMAPAALKVKRRLKIPIILDLHENYPAAILSYNWASRFPYHYIINPKRWRRLEKDILSEVDKIIVLSEYYKHTLNEKYAFLNHDDICVYENVPNVRKLLSYRVDNKIINEKDSFFIFYFGVIAERRGIFTLLEAFKLLKQRSKNIKLLLIGPVDRQDKKRFNCYLTQGDCKERIIYYPWKDIKYIPSYISISDIDISPIIKNEQHESGVANKVFQYMLFGKPIVVSDCLPQQKIVEEESCGLVFKSGDAKELAEKIFILYKDPDLRKQLGENGRKAVKNKYNWNTKSQKLLCLYNTIDKQIQIEGS